MRLSSTEFDHIVHHALRSIPAEIRSYLNNTVISVRERATGEMKAKLGLSHQEEPLGIFVGASLKEQSFFTPYEYPSCIYIFQRPLEEMCATEEELEEQIRITVIHEVAHLLGISEERLAELGYG